MISVKACAWEAVIYYEVWILLMFNCYCGVIRVSFFNYYLFLFSVLISLFFLGLSSRIHAIAFAYERPL